MDGDLGAVAGGVLLPIVVRLAGLASRRGAAYRATHVSCVPSCISGRLSDLCALCGRGKCASPTFGRVRLMRKMGYGRRLVTASLSTASVLLLAMSATACGNASGNPIPGTSATGQPAASATAQPGTSVTGQPAASAPGSVASVGGDTDFPPPSASPVPGTTAYGLPGPGTPTPGPATSTCSAAASAAAPSPTTDPASASADSSGAASVAPSGTGSPGC
jgi:hypothetical protein